MFKSKFITPEIIHINADTQYEISSMLVRMQEFYECPNDKFRGKYFTLDEFMDWYATLHPEGKFLYFEDWAGFNIPGDSLIKFWTIFTSKEILRPKEIELFRFVKDFIMNDDPNFCVIGTFDANDSILAHEMRHANYYLNKTYRQQCDDIFNELPLSIKDNVIQGLLDMGYHENMIPDETQAYFGTETPLSITNMFNLKDSPDEWVNKFKNISL